MTESEKWASIWRAAPASETGRVLREAHTRGAAIDCYAGLLDATLHPAPPPPVAPVEAPEPVVVKPVPVPYNEFPPGF